MLKLCTFVVLFLLTLGSAVVAKVSMEGAEGDSRLPANAPFAELIPSDDVSNRLGWAKYDYL